MENANQELQVQPLPQLTSSHSKLPWILLVVVLLIEISTISYILGTQQTQNLTQYPQPSAYSQSTSSLPSPSTDQTTNWKTYTTAKHTFSFQYPDTFYLVKGPGTNLPDEEFQKSDGVSFSEKTSGGLGSVFNVEVAIKDAMEILLSARQIKIALINI